MPFSIARSKGILVRGEAAGRAYCLMGIDRAMRPSTAVNVGLECFKSRRHASGIIQRFKKYISRDSFDSRLNDVLNDIHDGGLPYQFQAFRKYKGKFFVADDTLVPTEMAQDVPEFQSVLFTDAQRHVDSIREQCKGKVTLITLGFSFTRYCEGTIGSFKKPFLEHFKDSPDVQVLELRVMEKGLKSFLFGSYLRRTVQEVVPKDELEKYHIYHGDFRFCRYVFNISNRFISYVALVDKDAKVRWTAHGAAADSEIAYLKDAVTELINDGTQTGKQEKV